MSLLVQSGHCAVHDRFLFQVPFGWIGAPEVRLLPTNIFLIDTLGGNLSGGTTSNGGPGCGLHPLEKEFAMVRATMFAAILLLPSLALAQGARLNDAQIAHIAYTAGVLDVAAGKQALSKASSPKVREFAQEMVRDHQAVNEKALALVKKLNVIPEDNATSQALTKGANAKQVELAKLSGPAFDKAYIENEVAYHKTVNGALQDTLIPGAQNGELKSLLETGLKLFQSHQMHAEHLAADFK